MPAAAVTPAPEAYIKVVAVKKLVVGSGLHGRTPWFISCTLLVRRLPGVVVVRSFCRIC